MRCLFVIPHPLLPANQGPKHHTLSLLGYLAQRHECEVMGLYDPGAGESWARSARELPARVVGAFPRSRDGASLRLRQLALMARGLPWSLACYWSESAEQFLRALPRQRYDVVCLDMSSMAQYAEACAGMPTVLLGHDAYSLAMLRSALHGRGLGYRGRMLAQAMLQISFERRQYPRVGAVACVSEVDRRWLARIAPAARVDVVEIALPEEVTRRSPRATTPVPARIVCWGNLATDPIAAGVASFITRGWPRMLRAIPEAELVIWGRSPPAWLRQVVARSPATTHIEYVEDWVGQLAGAAVAIYPQRCGAGVQTKVQAALAFGVPVVASRETAEPVGLEHGATALIGATPEMLASGCILLLTDRRERERIGEAGRRHALARFDPERTGGQLAKLLREVTVASSDGGRTSARASHGERGDASAG
ncbi:MAG TPA: glycosyltransferase family 4 protein [Anaeromyxobacteraceae bacterium]|nr:glycosyltransferase family 4 protein [Anaeromyxobacteraceae bacterium]